MANKLKTVISASRRSDIPAYYLGWFIEKIKSGYVDVENPFNPKQISRINLLPDITEWIVFWSRDYSKFIRRKDFFLDYNLYFHFTINSENSLLSPNPPVLKEDAFKQAEELCKNYSQERVMWRFDPVFFYNNTSNYSKSDFKDMCRNLSGAGVLSCTTSFASPYKKTEERIRNRGLKIEVNNPSNEKKARILNEMQECCSRYGIKLYLCSNADIGIPEGVLRAGCINADLLNTLSDNKVSTAVHKTRPGCGCTKSFDIGSYNYHPCKTGCLYCYANKSNA
jgi:hypothetical protein